MISTERGNASSGSASASNSRTAPAAAGGLFITRSGPIFPRRSTSRTHRLEVQVQKATCDLVAFNWMWLVFFGIYYFVGKMDIFEMSYNVDSFLTNAILLSIINTSAATISHGVTCLAILLQKRVLLLLVISTLPMVHLITITFSWKIFRNVIPMFVLSVGLLMFACIVWLKEIQLYQQMDNAHVNVAREGPRSSSATADLEAQIYVIDEPPAYESLQVPRIATPPPKYDEVDKSIPTAFSETSASQNKCNY